MVAPNDILGYYRIIEKLGAGGMGEVWKAEDTRLGRIVAVKILPAKVATDHEAMARMRREARTAAQINSPNIATIYSFEEIGERLFIVMEYVEGEPLTKLIERGPIAEADLCRIGRAVAEALAEAHAKGIVHRDIKPDNIIVNGPRVKVLDFGIAKQVGVAAASGDPTSWVTQQGMIIGTVQYMSPEQALGKPLDARTDIFSLGVVLYQAATGRLPFRGETITETITQIVRDEPQDAGAVNNSLSPNFTRIIGRCLRKPPDQRFESAADLASALDAQLSRAVTAPGTRKASAAPTVKTPTAPATLLTGSKLQTVQEPARRSSMVWVVAAVAIVAAAVAGFIAFARRASVAPVNVPVTAAAARPASTLPPPGTSVSVTAAPDTSATTAATSTIAATAVAPTVTEAAPAVPEKPEPAPVTASVAPPAQSADQLYAQGMVDLKERRVVPARAAFLAALEADGHYAPAHLRLGEMALFAREPAVARRQFETALADQERLDPRERKLSHMGLAITNANWERARQIGAELHRENPDDPDIATFHRFLEQAKREKQEKPRGFRRQ